MSEIKANHICKNPECRKHYYACNFCDRNNNWKSVACSFSCYQKYMDLVIAERSKGKVVEVKPERTDMTEKEVDVLLESPIEKILEDTKEELKDYVGFDGSIDINKAVEDVNYKLEKKTTTRSRKKKDSENG